MITLPREAVTGDGVLLRPFIDADIPDITTALNDPETQRFLPLLPDPYREEHASAWVRQDTPRLATEGQAHLAIVDPGTDRLLGAVGLHGQQLDGWATSVGYWVAPWARGRGVATGAARAITTWAFQRGFGRIELTTNFANVASQRVALAAGYRHEGVRRAASRQRDGSYQDKAVWVRLATDDGEPIRCALPDLPGGRLTDGVVTLRRLEPADAPAMYGVMSLPEVVATTVSAAAPTPDGIAERCRKAGFVWTIGAMAQFAVRDAATDAFAGDIGLYNEPQTGQAMIGYSLAREWRGRGYASRAARLVADWAFDHAGIARVVAGTAPDNIGSQRTLQRAGFTREGYERERLPGVNGGPRIDDVVWALLPSDRDPP